ncbi:MHO_1580 family protein [Mycoplasmopsis cricetuli]|uniref:MHO_1580 family protein n=1 Tax=Mycoplasmopsis cricetuli TaxID=171283 RepID=UPI00046E6959|nr:hypothetical protein [Mycoplasmopsis cricetuli]
MIFNPIVNEFKLDHQKTIINNINILGRWKNKSLFKKFYCLFNIDRILSNGFFDINLKTNYFLNKTLKQKSLSLIINEKIILDHIEIKKESFNLDFRNLDLEFKKIKQIILIFHHKSEDIGQFNLNFNSFINIEKNISFQAKSKLIKIPSEINFLIYENSFKRYDNYLNIECIVEELNIFKHTTHLATIKMFYDSLHEKISSKQKQEKSFPVLKSSTFNIPKLLNKTINLNIENQTMFNDLDPKNNELFYFNLFTNINTISTNSTIELSESISSESGIKLPSLFSGELQQVITLVFDEYKINFIKNSYLQLNQSFVVKNIPKLKIYEISFEKVLGNYSIELEKLINFLITKEINSFEFLLEKSKKIKDD